MPTVTCSSCAATLKVSDTALGKKLKCPKCSQTFVAGQKPKAAAEDDFVTAEVAQAKPRRRSEDDLDDERDEPRRRRDHDGKAPAKSRTGLWIAVGGCSVAVAAAVVSLVITFSGGGDDTKKPQPIAKG